MCLAGMLQEDGTCKDGGAAATCDDDAAILEGETNEGNTETTELFSQRDQGIKECPEYTKLFADGSCKAEVCEQGSVLMIDGNCK